MAAKNPVGAPPKYKPEFAERVDDYLKQSQDEWTEFHKTRGERSDTYERILRVKLPSKERFAEFLGFSVDALDDWEKNYPEFGGALRKIKQAQRVRLIEESLAGNYNPLISKMLLSANHGIHETSEQIIRPLQYEDLAKAPPQVPTPNEAIAKASEEVWPE